LALVVWENADVKLIQAWNALTWAFAAHGNGQIETGDGRSQTAAEFKGSADLPAMLNEE
jgi:hypothetical protein